MASTASSSSSSSGQQLQVKLLTFQPEFAVPDTVLSVPADIRPEGLNQLLHKLLQEAKEDDHDDDSDNKWKDKRFEFIVRDDFVREPLNAFLERRPEIATELAIEIR